MTHLSMLVTAEGDWVVEGSPQFLAALDDPDPDYDAALFAVKNLGFIRFQALDETLVEIELHPRNVALPALLAIQQQLLSSQARLFRIKYLEDAWKSEISASAERTVSRLSELCAPVYAPPATDRFIVERRDFAELFADEHHRLRPLAQKWRASFGYFDPSIISLALRHDLLSRLVIIGIKRRERDPRWRFIGEGHRWLGRQLTFPWDQEKVEEFPDREYAGWAAEFYKSVAASGQPRYDLVSATIQDERKTVVPIRYERLLLPWKTPSDETFVTLWSATADDHGRARAGSSGENSSPDKKSAKSSKTSGAEV